MTEQNFKIYKPYGYLSQFKNNQNTRKNKKLLGELHDFPQGIMAIGRLDETSEGLLLLTSNGVTSDQVRSKKVEKEYYVQVDGLITAEALKKLKNGVEISINGKKYETLPCQARKLEDPPPFQERKKKIRDPRHGPTSWISITIVEGKFRQVRKMTAAVGYATLRLVRVRIGDEHLDNLEPGEIRKVKNFKL
jgi:23S rRNA pseudouridine2457 synthase